MKPAKPKPHMVVSEERLMPKGTYQARCGKEVQRVEILFFWDEAEMGTMLQAPRGVCQDCAQLIKSDLSIQRHYVYAVRELRSGEAEE
jgi:hypothetical protein